MARFHFVDDYERLVAQMLAVMPRDEAMSAAVGGDYNGVGLGELRILEHAGLRDGMTVFDLGCGSGRLAAVLGREHQVEYFGTDIVQALLDYAAEKSPAEYHFILHRALSVPLPDQSVDFACAFSVFTHLLPSESYLYLEDIRRVLRPGGRIVFSFLEFGDQTRVDRDRHWQPFDVITSEQRASSSESMTHLNTHIERNAILAWARHLDLDVIEFLDVEHNLGQTCVVLRRPDGDSAD